MIDAVENVAAEYDRSPSAPRERASEWLIDAS
jgi:hypothetical protein